MGAVLKPVLLLCVLVSLFLSTTAQTCKNQTFTNNALFTTCSDLPVLSSYLHWTYNSTTRSVNLAYRKTDVTSTDWVSWALNPSGSGMIGAQCLVAYQSDGKITAYTSPISGYGTTLENGTLSFEVSGLTAEYSNSEMTIFATVVLPSGGTSFNQVWQEGPVTSGAPQQHPLNTANKQSTGTIDFQSGQASAGGGAGNSKTRRRNVHGVLNAVSWGTLMPLGAIIARYLRVAKSADPAWFYLHIACQTSAYAVGVGGWATGIKLGSDSPSIQYDSHRNIGIALFALGTLQVFALLLRPKPDHKYRLYWNIYHHMTGYVVIILSVVNIYKGFDILEPAKKWKRIYTGVIIALGIIAIVLEVFTWIIVLKRKKNAAKPHPNINGANGNGYGARPQQVV